MSISNILIIEITLAKGMIPAEGMVSEKFKHLAKLIMQDCAGLMYHHDEDEQFQICVGALIIYFPDGSVERTLLTDSMRPLRMLSAAIDGIPVNWAALESRQDLYPLLQWWRECKNET